MCSLLDNDTRNENINSNTVFKLEEKQNNNNNNIAYKKNLFNSTQEYTFNHRQEIRNKKIIVTTALPYANGSIHLGHIASTYLPADIFSRFLRLSGNQVFHICATDDYGTPILIKSEKVGKSPQEYVRYWNEKDKKDFDSLGINFDYFYKTSSKENITFVQNVFKYLYRNNHIEKRTIIQFYCNFDNKYLPDRYVIGQCPFCKAENQYSDLCESCGRVPEEILNPKCAICGNTPVKKNSEHYFFKLSNFSSELKSWLLHNKNLQQDIVKYVINWIDSGLQDWDITRDLSWGVPIPNLDNMQEQDIKGKVFYGWFDNHLCYISTFETFISNTNKGDGKKIWNESDIYHFIGKDIVYHHYLFLPAIRIGINNEYKLPDNIITRGHLLFQNKKLSKSKNWYIGLEEFLASFEADYLRFYFASIVPFSQSDINFDWQNFQDKINNELISNIGNFINRTLSFTNKQFNGIVPSITNLEKIDNEIIEKIKQAPYEIGKLIFTNEIDKSVKKILQLCASFNQYFQTKQPWKSTINSNNTIWVSINAVGALAILLNPYLPFSAQKIWNQLGFNDNVNSQDWYSAGNIYLRQGHKISQNIEPVFRKIEDKEIKNKIKI